MAFADGQTEATISEGIGPETITLAGTVTKGDVLGYSSGWKRALATTGTAIQGKLIAGQSGVTDGVITGYVAARVGGRFSGGTIQAPVYSAEGTDNGKITETKPTTSGDVNKQIGFMVSATEAWLAPGLATDSVA